MKFHYLDLECNEREIEDTFLLYTDIFGKFIHWEKIGHNNCLFLKG